jgi:hypothetical protein
MQEETRQIEAVTAEKMEEMKSIAEKMSEKENAHIGKLKILDTFGTGKILQRVGRSNI